MTRKTLENAAKSGFSASSRPPVLLASESARRQEMLEFLGIPFTVCAPRTEETWLPGESPVVVAVRLARAKARACSRADCLVIAMDTIVVLGRRILGKPGTAEEAAAMLRQSSGRTHRVITGVALDWQGRLAAGSETTRVSFRPLGEKEIRWYVASGEPFDKAGGYGIQGRARLFVSRIDGCFYNVVGFPITLFQKLLGDLKLSVYDLMAER